MTTDGDAAMKEQFRQYGPAVSITEDTACVFNKQSGGRVVRTVTKRCTFA